MTWLNIGCGPFRAPEPWINLDVHRNEHIDPDVIVEDATRPLAAWENGTVDRVYMGHVLEHIPWPEVGAFLTDVARAMRPGGEICIVGPDVLRVIQRWKHEQDSEGWQLVESILEGPWDRDLAEGYGLIERLPEWPYARHWWNCYERRVVFALEEWSPFTEVTPQPITPAALGSWPLVAYTQWQCAVTARRAGDGR